MDDFKFPIEAGHILLFARSVGDPNPVYRDRGGEVIPPPTFYQSAAQFEPGYFLRPKIGEPWFGSGKTPTGVEKKDSGGDGGTGLHAEQRFEYHKPVKPGDVLTVSRKPGKTWEKQGRRGGKLIFSESVTEYRNQNGELVVTATGVGVKTEKVVEQE